MRVAFDWTHAELNQTGLGRYPRDLRRALTGVEVLPLTAPRLGNRIAQGLAREAAYYPALLARAARRAGADVLHLPTPAPARGGGLPLVVTIHDLLPLRMPELFTRETRAHTRLYLPFVRRATRILTNSEWTRREVIDLLGVPEHRVVATPFGIDDRFAPLPGDPERFGLRQPYVLSVGTLEPRKNLVGVLRAFRRLGRDDVQLAIVGGRGWHREALERELADSIDRVRVLGFVDDDDLVGLYSGAACFVFPSLAEGFGFPPLEAMACGAPVVTSDRAALPEVTGDAALHVDPMRPEAIAEAIARVLDEPELADDLRRRGVERARGFTWAACAEKTVSAYREASSGA